MSVIEIISTKVLKPRIPVSLLQRMRPKKFGNWRKTTRQQQKVALRKDA